MKDYEKFLKVLLNQKKQNKWGYDNLNPEIKKAKHRIDIRLDNVYIGFSFCRKTGRLQGIFNWKE